jgi:hypothetical protein
MATRLTTILVAVIVGATFIAGLIVGAQRDDASGPVDLIIVNFRKPSLFAATRFSASDRIAKSSGCAARKPWCSTPTAGRSFPD